jgi:hypothetical protein
MTYDVAHAEVLYGLDAGVGYTDNIQRTPVNEVDETIILAGVDLNWLEERPRLNADVRVDLNYNEYVDDAADSELTGNADGTVVFGLVPERFTWLVQDSFGQAQQDPLAAATPANRENINYFTTGPNVIFRFGSAAALRLLGRYSLSTYEDSPLDSERTSGGFVLSRELSGRSSVALNGTVEEVDFDDPASPDFDRKVSSLSYTLNASRTDITAEVGYSWIERDVDVDADSSGVLVRLELVRRVSASSTVNLTAGTQLTDASEALRSELGGIETGIGGGSGGGASVTATADIFENRFASAGWQFARGRTALGLDVGWEEDSYETQPQLDSERLIYVATLERQLGRAGSARLSAGYTTEDFPVTNDETEELRIAAALSWRLGRNIGLALTGERSDRESTAELGGAAVENRVFLTMFYRPLPGAP